MTSHAIRRSRWLITAVLALVVAPLSAQSSLTVFAAASLTEAYRDLGHRFEQANPGVTVRFNFAGSQILATQLAQGAKADLFASADQRWMTYADEQHLLLGAPLVFARNQLVVMVPRANPARLHRLEDLARPGVKLVLAGRQVPAGAYAHEALARLAKAPGFPADYDRQVLENLVSEEENVRAVAAKVQLGEADAGIVYLTDVTPAIRPLVALITIPEAFNPTAEYPVALLAGAREPQATAFLQFLLGSEGQSMLASYGFLPPAPR